MGRFTGSLETQEESKSGRQGVGRWLAWYDDERDAPFSNEVERFLKGNANHVKSIKRNSASYQATSGVSITRSARELASAGASLFTAHHGVRVWLFSGPLGAGKSTMIRGMLRAAGYRRIAQSPTYVLVHPYRIGPMTVVHVDAYRVRAHLEWAALGLEEWLHHPNTAILIEWPEKLPPYRWGNCAKISIGLHPRGRRIWWQIMSPAGAKRSEPRQARSRPRRSSRPRRNRPPAVGR